jgi:hypothetical protein
MIMVVAPWRGRVESATLIPRWVITIRNLWITFARRLLFASALMIATTHAWKMV